MWPHSGATERGERKPRVAEQASVGAQFPSRYVLQQAAPCPTYSKQATASSFAPVADTEPGHMSSPKQDETKTTRGLDHGPNPDMLDNMRTLGAQCIAGTCSCCKLRYTRCCRRHLALHEKARLPAASSLSDPRCPSLLRMHPR